MKVMTAQIASDPKELTDLVNSYMFRRVCDRFFKPGEMTCLNEFNILMFLGLLQDNFTYKGVVPAKTVPESSESGVVYLDEEHRITAFVPVRKDPIRYHRLVKDKPSVAYAHM